jgi:hypothetical protein
VDWKSVERRQHGNWLPSFRQYEGAISSFEASNEVRKGTHRALDRDDLIQADSNP